MVRRTQGFQQIPAAAALLLTASGLWAQGLPQNCGSGASSIKADFDSWNLNDSHMKAGESIWFSAVLSVKGVPSAGAQILFTNSTITYTLEGSPTVYTIPVPNGVVMFGPTDCGGGATQYSPGFGWMTMVPANQTDQVFMTGVPFTLPANHKHLENVTWNGTFSSSMTGLLITWKWRAKAYHNALALGNFNVKSADSGDCTYHNNDSAGAIEDSAIRHDQDDENCGCGSDDRWNDGHCWSQSAVVGCGIAVPSSSSGADNDHH